MRFDGPTDELNADGDAASKPAFQKYAQPPCGSHCPGP